MQIDDLDRKILQHLRDDGRVSYVALASKFNVSEGTIRKGSGNLRKQILQIVGVTDPSKWDWIQLPSYG